jgi:predicted permease
VFGRLAAGVTLEEAQAELTIIGQRAAAAHPETHARLRPLVLPYSYDQLGITDPLRLWAGRILLLLVGSLVFVVAVNLAILVYARTVTRLGEIAVRTALGASRRRLLAQLFIEALVLAMVGAGAGLMLADVALSRMRSLAASNASVPFWIDLELSFGTVIYAVGLTVLAAAIIGVLPGLKATSRRVHANLRQRDGRTGTRLGSMWTTLVVAQVAVAVAVLPMAVYLAWQVVRMEMAGPGFAAEEFAVGIVALSDEPAATVGSRLQGRQFELTSRLNGEPGVSAVTFSSGVPGFAPGRLLQFEADAGAKYSGTLGVNALDVGLDLFGAYGVEMLAGRTFTAADLGTAHAVIVNRSFAEEFLRPGPDSALGVRFHYDAPPERPGSAAATTYHVVGVIRDFPSFPPAPGSEGVPTVYHPAAPGDVHPLVLSVRFAGGVPDGFDERFRAISAEVDPALQVRRVVPLSAFYDQLRSFWRYLAWGLGLVTMSVILLSAAGIYALMSFTVAQRAREIAIRAALGAGPRRLLLAIFGRAARQLGLGLIAGSVLSALVFMNTDFARSRAAALVLAVAAIMLAVGLLAALGPARRGLRIQANEALKTTE